MAYDNMVSSELSISTSKVPWNLSPTPYFRVSREGVAADKVAMSYFGFSCFSKKDTEFK